MEEAARVLRIGRTKAYDLAGEWRETSGASGLPVVDLGSVLRVPRVQLESMIGGPVHLPTVSEPSTVDAPPAIEPAQVAVSTPVAVVARTTDHPPAHTGTVPTRSRRPRRPASQLDLFDTATS